MAASTPPNAQQQSTDQYNYAINGAYNTTPAGGAQAYASEVATNPQLDATLCQLIGKIVHVCAKVPKDTRLTAIRFTFEEKKSPYTWNLEACEDFQWDPEAKRYTVVIPRDQMNEQFQFKLVMNIQSSKSWAIDLKSCGFFTKIDLGSVTFA